MSLIQNTIFEFNYQMLQFILLLYTINMINLVVLSYNLYFNIQDLFFFTKMCFFLILLYFIYLLLFESVSLNTVYFLRDLSSSSPNFSLNIFINVLVLILVFSIFSSILSKGLERFFFITTSIFFLSIIILSFSRQSILAVLGVFAIITFHYFNKKKWLYFILLPSLLFFFIDEILFFIDLFSARFNTSGDSKRTFAYINGFYSFLNNPWGVGLGNYSLLNQTNFKVLESGHLQVLVELGLLYFLAYLLGIYKLFKSFKKIISPNIRIFSLSIFFVILWIAFFNEIIFTSMTLIPLYFFMIQKQRSIMFNKNLFTNQSTT